MKEAPTVLVGASFASAPLAGFEPALPPPEGGALSPELQGPYWWLTRRRGYRDIGVRTAAGRRYPLAVTPEQLSELVVAALTTLVERGAMTLPDGVPTSVTVERPRSKEHGDYATNVALQLGKK